jgi:hypothetical protein
MKLRMLTVIGGTHDGEPWPEVGGIVELTHPGAIADLVRNHYAEVVPEPELEPEPVIETAAVEPPQNAAKHIAKPKARRSSRPAKEG